MNSVGTMRIKWSYVTHRVARDTAAGLAPLGSDPEPGRIVLARVLVIGRHREIEGTDGRKMWLFPGDIIAGALGDRYATDQYEGQAVAGQPGHLLGIGGVCGQVASKNERMVDPTTLEWLGGAIDAHGQPLNLRRFALRPQRSPETARARTILVVGASMNAGKTTTAAQVIRSLTGHGRRVAAAKITGTACRKDPGIMEDGGALPVLDFTHCGYASTANLKVPDLLALAVDLRAALVEQAPECIVYEIADGIFQRETRILLEDAGFRASIDAVVFAGPDSPACEAGVRRLRDWGYNVAAVAGMVANSRLGIAEVEASTGVPCLNGAAILDGALAHAVQPASVA